MARHLLVTNDFPPKVGGIQSYLYELWRRLEPGRATVLTASSDPGAAAFDAAQDLVVERVATRTLYLPTAGARRAIEGAIERHRPDLVLLDPAWPLGLLGPSLSVPYGVVLHGAEVTIPSRLPVSGAMLRTVLRGAAVAVAAGHYPAAEARRNAGEDTPPILVVPPGVDVERFRPLGPAARRDARERLGLPAEGPVVFSYSRLVPRKGMDVLIDATARLAPHWPELVLAIGGAGRDRERLERRARDRGVAVRFLGRVPDEELPLWLGGSDLMVMDCRSRWLGLEQEGFGIVFAEAAAAGTPQVAGRSGGSHEAVIDGETGVVVDNPRDARALAAAIEGLLGDPVEARRRGQRARENAEAAFDWQRLADSLSAGLAPFDHFRATGAAVLR